MFQGSIRKKKLEKRIGQSFSQFLLYEVSDERLRGHFLSVTRVELNDDFSRGTIFFRSLDGNKNKFVKMLYHVQPFFMSYLRRKISLRKMPEIRFFYDEKYNKSDEVLNMMDDIRRKKDLEEEKL